MGPLRYGTLLSMINGKGKGESSNSLIQSNSAFNIYISYPSQFLSLLFVVTDCLPIDYIGNTQRKQPSSLWTDPQGSGRRVSKIPPFCGGHRNSDRSGQPAAAGSRNNDWAVIGSH